MKYTISPDIQCKISTIEKEIALLLDEKLKMVVKK